MSPLLIMALVAGGALVAAAVARTRFVPAGQVAQGLAEGALIIDVRTREEFGRGHVPGALNIPLGEICERLPAQVPDKEKVLLLHCHAGGRSAIAVQQLRRLGYRRAWNLGSYGRALKLISSPAPRER